MENASTNWFALSLLKKTRLRHMGRRLAKCADPIAFVPPTGTSYRDVTFDDIARVSSGVSVPFGLKVTVLPGCVIDRSGPLEARPMGSGNLKHGNSWLGSPGV